LRTREPVADVTSKCRANTGANSDENTDPTTATPIEPASSRVVSFTAEPAPTWSGRSVLMSDAVEGAFTSEKPRARRIITATTGPK